MRAPWIISPHSWLPRAIEAVVAAQNAPHTAETDPHRPSLLVTDLREVVPDHLSTALELCAQCQYALHDLLAHLHPLHPRVRGVLSEGGGQFIHHAPSDEEGVDYGTGDIARTVAALKQYGFIVDEPLWANTGHDCSNYCSGDSCSGGGGDGDSGCQH